MGAEAVLGADAVKLRSCLTLFASIDEGDDFFAHALEVLFHGEWDARTVALLAVAQPDATHPGGDN